MALYTNIWDICPSNFRDAAHRNARQPAHSRRIPVRSAAIERRGGAESSKQSTQAMTGADRQSDVEYVARTLELSRLAVIDSPCRSFATCSQRHWSRRDEGAGNGPGEKRDTAASESQRCAPRPSSLARLASLPTRPLHLRGHLLNCLGQSDLLWRVVFALRLFSIQIRMITIHSSRGVRCCCIQISGTCVPAISEMVPTVCRIRLSFQFPCHFFGDF